MTSRPHTGSKPDLVFLAHRIPYPPNKGDKIRSFNELLFLSRHFNIHLFCPYDQKSDAKYLEDLRKHCETVHATYLNRWRQIPRMLWAMAKGESISVALFRLGSLKTKVLQTLGRFPNAPIMVFSGQMADYVPSKDLPRAVIDFCDVDSKKWQQYSETMRGLPRLFYRLEAKRLSQFEKRIAGVSQCSIFITQAECDLFRTAYGTESIPAQIQAMPNGVNTEAFAPDPGHEMPGRILFTGAMDYYPNVEGVDWFVKSVMPLLRGKVPSLRCIIAGSNPAAQVRRLENGEDVEVTGFVPEMRDELKKATLVIVPLRIARGMQNKVLEALACGKAVVATSQSLGGIDAHDREILRIADTAEAFAAAILEVLADTELRQRLEVAGRAYMVETFSWENRLKATLMPLLLPTVEKAH